MADLMTVDGIQARITQPDYGQGGQGKVHLAQLAGAPQIPVIIKEMPLLERSKKRAELLCNMQLPVLSPGLVSPLAFEALDGTLRHLAPFAEGEDIEHNSPPRGLPQYLEIGLEICCLLTILADNNLGHGDIAPSNVLIGADGEVSLIDFDGFISSDPDVPPPHTIGQRPMLAPELRSGNTSEPTLESDLFALGVFLSYLFSGRYPTDGLAEFPAEVDQIMMQGDWPERHRQPEAGELPIEAFGQDLQDLFDRAFSLDPQARPTADAWRRGLTKALHNCWIHDCGQSFVADPHTAQCPWCGGKVKIEPTEANLKIVLSDSGPRYGVTLKDRATVVLGRQTIPGLPGTVSARQLEITPFGSKLLLRHVGRHDTLIKHKKNWYRLDQYWISAEALKTPLQLQLAGFDISIAIG